MKIDIQLLPFLPDPFSCSGQTVVVIDVLRATSVMVHALASGALEIIPVSTVDQAFERAKGFPPGSTLLGGERGNQRIAGFDLGNSPAEYPPEKVRGKRLVLTTTNGTRAFQAVSSGAEVVAAAFLNIRAVSRRCLASGKDLLVFPSGDEGRFSLEDAVCGGMLIDLVAEGGSGRDLTDAARSASILYRKFEKNLTEALRLSHHGKVLIRAGFEADLPYCAETDATEIVPVFREGIVRPDDGRGC